MATGAASGGRSSRCRHCGWPVEEFDEIGWLHVPYPWLGEEPGRTDPGWCQHPEPGAVIRPVSDHEPPPWR